MESKFRVTRWGGPLKLKVLAPLFSERFRVAIGNRNTPMPIHVFVSDIAAGKRGKHDKKTLRDVLKNITNSIGGVILLKALRCVFALLLA